MWGRKLFGKYRRRIEEIARVEGSQSRWQNRLKAVIDHFERDAASLEPESAQLLREELCEQLEHDALRATNPYRRKLLLAAVKRLETLY